MIRRGAAALIGVLAAAGVAAGSFDPGVLDAPAARSVALAGADVAVPGGFPLSSGSVAELGRLEGPLVHGGAAAATKDAGTVAGLAGGVVVDGIGLAASLIRWARGPETGFAAGLAGGLPVDGGSGLAVGMGAKALTAARDGDSAAGFALDAAASLHRGLPWRGMEAVAAVGVENAAGVLTWESGLKEEILPRVRIGLALARGPALLASELAVGRGAGSRDRRWGAALEYGLDLGRMPVRLRAGWRGDPGTVCGGVGLAHGPLSADYAVAAGPDTVLHSLSVEWRIPGPGRSPVQSGPVSRSVTASPASARTAEVTPSRAVFDADAPYRPLDLLLDVPRDEATHAWTVVIVSSGGGVVWEASGDGQPPRVLVWAGQTTDGRRVEAGDYVCRLLLRGASAPDYLSPGSSIRVVRTPAAKEPSTASPDGFDVPGPASGGDR